MPTYRRRKPASRWTPKRRTYGRKRRSYGRRALPTTTRRVFSPRRRPAYGRQLASIPLTIRNNVPRRRVIPITFTDSVTLYPEDDTLGQFGASSCSWRASSPNFVNYTGSNSLGVIRHMDPSNVSGINPMCEAAFARYEQFKVIKAKIEMVLAPTRHNTADAWKWVHSSNCYLTLSDSVSPWNVGTTVASIDPESSIRNGRNVKAGRLIISASGGAANKPISMTGMYTPRRVFDKHTDPSQYVGQTAGDYLVSPTQPTKEAYWNLMVLPGEAYPASAAGATWHRGVPEPTRVDLKITYMVEFFGVEVNTSAYQAYDNAPPA